MSAPVDGGPAFPRPGTEGQDYPEAGMSLRDWYAGQAMAAYLISMPALATYTDLAVKCFHAADALIAERAKVQP